MARLRAVFLSARSWTWIASQICAPIAVDGVQRRHRILEDHRHLVAADVLELAVVHLQHVAALVEHLTFEARVLVAREPEERHRGDALARARLADDPQHLSALQLEADAVDGLHGSVLGRELDLQVIHFDQAFGHQWPCRLHRRMPGSRAPSDARTQGALGLVCPSATEDAAARSVIAGRAPVDGVGRATKSA